MGTLFQEKYQITFKQPEARERWSDVSDALRAAKNRSMSCLRMAVDDSDPSDKFVQSKMAGETDVSDNVNQNTLLNGYGVLPMSPTEDMYSAEHRDNFYDDVGGFVERNNYLDRE